ncbi:terpene synthase family protein [Chitinophaga nivalis]|uniref:Terpene synthase n=1 Tax=Chitinophaga nivalis TaxID=2991709 RepID=A0ABT3IJ10_9BACT|nr:hypothetical protein [Chitinophaga nivalis]MCW3466362.1 hypothetical protein [Chitinophaga nivalis]MCW3483947.1 hypothetical protein [Chitinophaga nivalis]
MLSTPVKPFSRLLPLYCPFGVIESPFIANIEDKIKEWADDYSSLSPELRAAFKRSTFGELTARFFPTASEKMLRAAARHVLLFFAFDDLHGLSKNAHEVQLHCEKAILTLEGHVVTPENDDDVLHQFALLRTELLEISSPEWVSRYIADVKDFFDSLIVSCFFNARGIYPNVDYYMILREDLVGLYQLLGWVELASGGIFPHEMHTHPYIFQLRKLAVGIMAWANDYYSAAKEYKDGELMNLVLVIHQEYKGTLADAFDMAARIHNDAMTQFLELCETPPDFGAYNALFKVYIENLKQMILGNKIWSETTYRYAEQFENLKNLD